MKGNISTPPREETRQRPDTVESKPLPIGETEPNPLPQTRPRSHKKEIPPLALVVALLALAMLLFVPALILLERLQP